MSTYFQLISPFINFVPYWQSHLLAFMVPFEKASGIFLLQSCQALQRKQPSKEKVSGSDPHENRIKHSLSNIKVKSFMRERIKVK